MAAREKPTPEAAVARVMRFAEKRGPDGLARALRMMHIKGARGEPTACPWYRYFQHKFGDDRYISVTTGQVSIGVKAGVSYAALPTNAQFALFLNRFDDDEYYEDLIDRELEEVIESEAAEDDRDD